MNSLFCIHPYRWNGTWVFDDEARGLLRIQITNRQMGRTNTDEDQLLSLDLP